MAILTVNTEVHWNYFLAIESDLETLSRFVEFDERNFCCFSIEISKILLAAAAEVDVVCKQICKRLNPRSKAKSINRYREEILNAYPTIPKFDVLVQRYGLRLRPWDNWTYPDGVPAWWTAYNKIKHNRNSEYHRANLKNALNSVAGLFVVVLYLYEEKAKLAELVPSPKLLRPSEERFRGTTYGGFEFGINYNL